MRKIYVAHPLREAIPIQLRRLPRTMTGYRICRQIARDHTETLILSPIHAFQFFDALGIRRHLWISVETPVDVR